MSEHLIRGLSRFREEYFPRYEEHYRRLVTEGQSPSTLFIGCADSRVVPNLLTDTLPGDLFTVRNVGNLVPPFEDASSYHGVSAAIEYAVAVLRVKDVVVCGHSHCGAIRGIYDQPASLPRHVARWLELAGEARLEGPLTEELLRDTEQRSVILQLDHLMTFPLVKDAVERGDLALHGWHYVIEEGTVHVLDVASGRFLPV